VTRLLDDALARIARLPAPEQDALAAILLEELASEQRWAEAFMSSQSQLAALGAEAHAEHTANQTEPLDDAGS
jgi:hypothetical protein